MAGGAPGALLETAGGVPDDLPVVGIWFCLSSAIRLAWRSARVNPEPDEGCCNSCVRCSTICATLASPPRRVCTSSLLCLRPALIPPSCRPGGGWPGAPALASSPGFKILGGTLTGALPSVLGAKARLVTALTLGSGLALGGGGGIPLVLAGA